MSRLTDRPDYLESAVPRLASIQERLGLLGLSPQDCVDLARIALEFPDEEEAGASLDPVERYRRASLGLVYKAIRSNLRGDQRGVLEADCVHETLTELDLARRALLDQTPGLDDMQALDLATIKLLDQIQ